MDINGTTSLGGGWEELVSELDTDQDDDDGDWGRKADLDVGTTLTGWWRGEDEWEGDYGPTPVYLLTGETGDAFFFYGGRKQLDKKLAEAAPNVGDRVAIRRLEDAPAEEGRSPAWRVRVAVRPGDGTVPVAQASGVEADDDDDIPF